MADCHECLSNSLWGDPGIPTNQSVRDLIDHQSSQAGVETPPSLTGLYLELLRPEGNCMCRRRWWSWGEGWPLRRPIRLLLCSFPLHHIENRTFYLLTPLPYKNVYVCPLTWPVTRGKRCLIGVEEKRRKPHTSQDEFHLYNENKPSHKSTETHPVGFFAKNIFK